MKILIDECAPRAFEAQRRGAGPRMSYGSGSRLGRKIQWRASWPSGNSFEVFVTLDTNLRYQQNLAERRIAIIVMVARSNRLVELSRLFPACVEALKTIGPGEIIHIE